MTDPISRPLEGKHALVFAATGAISRGVARALAESGAHVWLSARREDAVAAEAAALRDAGLSARAHAVDALDPDAVAGYVGTVAAEACRVDVVFNGIGGTPADLGYPARASEQPLEDFLIPLRTIVGSQFLTAREAAPHMEPGAAVITLSATLSSMTAPFMASISAACGAVEAMTRSLAGELGPAGVRVNCVRASGMPETRTIQQTSAGIAALRLEDGGSPAPMAAPPLGRPVTVADTARVASFLASDAASGMTGQVVTVCGGHFV